MEKEKICPACNNKFITHKINKIYCCRKCYNRVYGNKYYYKNRKKLIKYNIERHKKPKIKKLCVICNKPLYTHMSNNIYCCRKCQRKGYKKEQYLLTKNWVKNAMKTNSLFKLTTNSRSLVYQSIKRNKQNWKRKKFPFTYEELFNHLEKEFPKGYSWDNYLKNNILHLEHKIPLSWFNNEEEFFKIGWNLNNLTFLTKEKNIKKSNKYAIVNNIKYYNKEKAINKFKELYLVN